MQKLHADEVETGPEIARRLVSAQFPQFSHLPLIPIQSGGTDHTIYRLGRALALRLPKIESATRQARKEETWLPRLAPHLPLAIPEQVAIGQPDEWYPFEWSIYRWIDGEPSAFDKLTDPTSAAAAIAHFLTSLWEIDPTGGPLANSARFRGGPLRARDAQTRHAIAACTTWIDPTVATQIWDDALHAADWGHPPAWYHGDLLRGNVLIKEGAVSAVIDFGNLGLGDPACDLMIAWSLFDRKSRAVFREILCIDEMDEGMWARGRGWALSQAVIYIPYYSGKGLSSIDYAINSLQELALDFDTSAT